MASVDSDYFGRRLREHHTVALSDDDAAISALLDQLLSVEFEREKPSRLQSNNYR